MKRQAKSKLDLEALSIEQLVELRERADELIASRLQNEKRALQEKLSAIARYEQKARAGGPIPDRIAERKKAQPKYRDPSSGATWAGRGQVPRWMAEYIKRGAKREDFRINDGIRRE